MKFSIDARGINLYKGSGIGTYTENLLRELLNIDTKNNYSIFWTGENYEDYKKDNSKIIFTSKKHGTFYENYYYPNYIEENNIDMHHIPQNGIGLNELYTSPIVVTIHDLIPYILPETVGRGYLERFLRDMPLIVRDSKVILTVSEYSKRDIIKFFPFVNEEKIFVTPLAANKSYKPLNKTNCIEYIKDPSETGISTEITIPDKDLWLKAEYTTNYKLTVIEGQDDGDGYYCENETVESVYANAPLPESRLQFDHWDDPMGIIKNIYDPTPTIVMKNTVAVITAVFTSVDAKGNSIAITGADIHDAEITRSDSYLINGIYNVGTIVFDKDGCMGVITQVDPDGNDNTDDYLVEKLFYGGNF